MPPTRIFHNYTKLPIISTLCLLFANYELYRITTGRHPYIHIQFRKGPASPTTPSQNTDTVSKEDLAKREEVQKAWRQRRNEAEKDKATKDKPFGDRMPLTPGPAWVSLNGIPVPSFELLMRPLTGWRRD